MVVTLGDAEVAVVAVVLAEIDAAQSVEREAAETGFEHVGRGAAEVRVVELPIPAHQGAVAVGLQEIRIGGAVGPNAIDVDVGVVAAAVLLAVDERAGPVGIGGHFEKEVPHALPDRELQVLEALGQDGRVGRDGELLRRRPEKRVGDGSVEAVGGHVDGMQERGSGGVERGQGTLNEPGDWRGRAVAAGQRDGVVLVVHDRLRAAEGHEDVVVGAAAADAEGVGVRGQGRGGGDSVVGGLAVPAGQAVIERGKAGLAGVGTVFALEADLSVAERPQRAGQERGFAAIGILHAPAIAVAPDRGQTQGRVFREGPVDVEGSTVIAPGADAELHDVERAVGLGALGGGGTDAAEAAVAEQDRVRAAAEVVALQVIAVAVVELREKIALWATVAGATGGIVDRRGEKVLLPVVDVERGADGPLGRGLQVGQVERVDQLAIDDGVRGGRVAQIERQASAGERAGRGEAGVAGRVNLEGRKGNGRLGGRVGLGRFAGCRGGGQRLGKAGRSSEQERHEGASEQVHGVKGRARRCGLEGGWSTRTMAALRG